MGWGWVNSSRTFDPRTGLTLIHGFFSRVVRVLGSEANVNPPNTLIFQLLATRKKQFTNSCAYLFSVLVTGGQ